MGSGFGRTGIDWIIEHHVKGQDHAAAIQKRHSIQNQVERVQHLFVSGHIDAAVEARKILNEGLRYGDRCPWVGATDCYEV